MADADIDTESYVQAAAQTLSRFATHTRHAPHEYDTADGATKLAQKWLALHVKSVPPALIMAAHVSPDYNLLELRTYDPPLSVAYESQPPETRTFVHLMKHGYPRNEPVQGAAHFRETIFPRTRDEESWVAYHERADEHWKERAYYVAAQCGYPYGLVEAIYSDGLPDSRATKDGASDMYTRISAYVRDHGTMPEDVGAMIGQLNMELDLVGCCHDGMQGGPSDTIARDAYLQHKRERGELENEDEAEGTSTNNEIQMTFAASQPIESSPAPLDPTHLISAYRTASLLPATFPPHKILKQMTLARAGLTGTEPAVRESGILSRTQAGFGPLNGNEIAPHALVHDSLVGLEVALDLKSPALQELYAGLAFNGTAPEFVRAALDMYAPPPKSGGVEPTPFERKYKKRYPTLDASVVRAVLGI
jgi:hypothetical protein